MFTTPYLSQKPENELAIAIMDQIPAMIAYWDKDMVCRFANNAYSDWFGTSKDAMIDKMTLEELLGPELFALNKPYILAALEGKKQNFERKIPTPNRTRYALANYIPNIVHGKVDGFFVHVTDISHIKNLQDELLENNEKFKVQNKRLLNFANIVTHNLKSYANNLSITLQFLEDSVSEAEKNEMISLLKEISSGFTSTIVHLSEIVDVENVKLIKNEEINLISCINHALKPLRVQIKDTRAIIQNNVKPHITVWANRAYLDSIILNLLSNAIKYKDINRDPIIEIDAIETKNEVILSIKDNGAGIDLNKNKDSLFGLYKTFHGNKDAKGIGLYLVKSQIEAMGGSIEVDSQVSKGSIFRVHFQKLRA